MEEMVWGTVIGLGLGILILVHRFHDERDDYTLSRSDKIQSVAEGLMALLSAIGLIKVFHAPVWAGVSIAGLFLFVHAVGDDISRQLRKVNERLESLANKKERPEEEQEE